VTLAFVSLPLLALSLRVLPTLGSVNEGSLPPIYGETPIIGPRARSKVALRTLARGSSRIHALLQRLLLDEAAMRVAPITLIRRLFSPTFRLEAPQRSA
jgi:hypothetical protein